jgi:hypothetical protein
VSTLRVLCAAPVTSLPDAASSGVAVKAPTVLVTNRRAPLATA